MKMDWLLKLFPRADYVLAYNSLTSQRTRVRWLDGSPMITRGGDDLLLKHDGSTIGAYQWRWHPLTEHIRLWAEVTNTCLQGESQPEPTLQRGVMSHGGDGGSWGGGHPPGGLRCPRCGSRTIHADPRSMHVLCATCGYQCDT